MSGNRADINSSLLDTRSLTMYSRAMRDTQGKRTQLTRRGYLAAFTVTAVPAVFLIHVYLNDTGRALDAIILIPLALAIVATTLHPYRPRRNKPAGIRVSETKNMQARNTPPVLKIIPGSGNTINRPRPNLILIKSEMSFRDANNHEIAEAMLRHPSARSAR